MKLLKIAARKSDLARIQVYEVAQALLKVDPQLQFEYQFSQSLGDKNLEAPLWQMPEKGVFTRDLQIALVDGKVDLVVHSWKDLPIDGFDKTEVVATLPRQEMRDLLLFKAEHLIPNTASALELKILSSSPRRSYNLSGLIPQLLPLPVKRLEFVNVRGNVGTRIEKLLSGEFHGLIVAGAAINRLLNPPVGYEDELLNSGQTLAQKLLGLRWMILPIKENPTAAAQGALAIEVRRDRKDLIQLLRLINHVPTFECVSKERQTLAQYGGGCHQKLGISVLNRAFGEVCSVRGIDEKQSIPLERWELTARNSAAASRILEAEMWPSKVEDSTFFRRKPIGISKPADVNGFIVSRADALPDSWTPDQFTNEILWASGTRTWKKLAERGFWVNGSLEGLGESRPEFSLIPPDARWSKLTHQDSEAFGVSEVPVLATYELVAKKAEESPKFLNKKHYFWMSATACLRALELDPSIARARHSCGPGNTFQILGPVLERLGSSLTLYLDFDHWRQSVVADPEDKI